MKNVFVLFITGKGNDIFLKPRCVNHANIIKTLIKLPEISKACFLNTMSSKCSRYIMESLQVCNLQLLVGLLISFI